MHQNNMLNFYFRQLRNSYLLKAVMVVMLGFIAFGIHKRYYHTESYWIVLATGLFLTMCAMSIRTFLYSRSLAKH